MESLIYVTNIPTPYREYRFSMLNRLLLQQHRNLEVVYLGLTERGRNWQVDLSKSEYSNSIWNCFSLYIRGSKYYFFSWDCVKLILRSYRENIKIVVGGFYSPIHWLLLCFSKRETLILSVESNLDSEVNSGVLSRWVKKSLVSRADTVQITGIAQKEYIQAITKKHFSYVVLPNVVEERPFKKLMKRRNDTIFISARLIEIKGLLEFCNAVKHLNVKVRIAGEGPLKPRLASIANVECLGYLAHEEMQQEYLSCGFFVLPSLKDPSPLSLLEALRYGCVILASKFVGNYRDVYEADSDNIFDINDSDDISKVVSYYLSKSDEELNDIRKSNVHIYKQNFAAEVVLKRYVKRIIYN